jgi:hypothetical protein
MIEIDFIQLLLLFLAGLFGGIGIGRASLTRKIRRLENKLKEFI